MWRCSGAIAAASPMPAKRLVRMPARCRRARRHELPHRPGHDRQGACLRPRRRRTRSTPSPIATSRSRRSAPLDRRHASVAACRGDRAVDLAAIRVCAALRQVHHRLFDHAAEAEPRRRRAGARQDGQDRRRLPGPAHGDEGPPARLCQGHAGGQGARVRRARFAEARRRRHDRHGRGPRARPTPP